MIDSDNHVEDHELIAKPFCNWKFMESCSPLASLVRDMDFWEDILSFDFETRFDDA